MMLRTREGIKAFQRLHVTTSPPKCTRVFSSTLGTSEIESPYSLTYTYRPPPEITSESAKTTTVQAMSIEEVRRQKTAFETYRSSLIQAESVESAKSSANLGKLFQRQLDLEQELNHKTAVESITNIVKLTEMGKSANLKTVQRVLLEWYIPFVACLDEKVEALGTIYKLEAKIQAGKGDKKVDIWKAELGEKKAKHDDLWCHGPILSFLPTEKLAVITMNAVVNHILSSGNQASASALCKEVAEIVETEVNLSKSLGQRLWVKSWQREQVKDATGKPQIVKALGRQIRKYYGALVFILVLC